MSNKKKIRGVKVVEKKLGRENALGLCYKYNGLIEIDPRQDSKEYLDTLVHELLHFYFPVAAEWRVDEVAHRIAAQIWKRQFRRLQK